jgi:hypothetical protein
MLTARIFFEYSQPTKTGPVWLSNSPVFERHSKTGPICPVFEWLKQDGRKIDLLAYTVLYKRKLFL